MVPVGTIGVYNETGILSQADLFTYKARECKSAPARTSEPVDESINSRTSSCKKPRRNYFTWGKLYGIFIGHAPEVTKWTSSFQNSSKFKYLTCFFIETFFRSIGSVTFCSNPFSGLMIFTAMLISCSDVAFLAFLTLSFGILTATLFLKIPLEQVRSGGVAFNNFLTGTVIGLLADENALLIKPHIILVCMLMGILTVMVWRGLNGALANNLEFPLLNAPFHVILLLYILSGSVAIYQAEKPAVALQVNHFQISRNGTGILYGVNHALSSDDDRDMSGNFSHMLGNQSTSSIKLASTLTTISPLHDEMGDVINTSLAPSLHWMGILDGIFLAPSQVFGTDSVSTSMLIYLAILLYSPIMLMQSIFGVVIGTLIGSCLCNSMEYETLYNGSWGYNPLFTSAALGGFLIIFNIYSCLLAITGAILTALLYSAMVKCHIPVLGIPFMLTTWILVPSVSSKQTGDEEESKESSENNGPFHRLRMSQITTPELHRNLLVKEKTHTMENKYASKNTSPSPIPQSVGTTLPLPL